MLIGVRCSWLIDAVLLLKRFADRNMEWEDGTKIDYSFIQTNFHHHANNTVYVVDTENPRIATRSCVQICRQRGIEVRTFDEFYHKNFANKK